VLKWFYECTFLSVSTDVSTQKVGKEGIRMKNERICRVYYIFLLFVILGNFSA